MTCTVLIGAVRACICDVKSTTRENWLHRMSLPGKPNENHVCRCVVCGLNNARLVIRATTQPCMAKSLSVSRVCEAPHHRGQSSRCAAAALIC